MSEEGHNYTFAGWPEMPWKREENDGQRLTRAAVIIPNYNMPERTEKIVRWLEKNEDPLSYDLYVVDNGSDLVAPAYGTNVSLPRNRQTTLGILAGLDAAKLSEKFYFAYWVIITSTEFPDGQEGMLTNMLDVMTRDARIAIMHPGLTDDSTTAWNHLKQHHGEIWNTWMVDNIAALYNAKWFDSIGWFDPLLTMAWGIDLETCYKARQQDKRIVVDGRYQVRKTTNIGYTMGRMNMSAEERTELAHAQMAAILEARYGPTWHDKMYEEGVTDALRGV
jgi:hypothetical protein